MPLPRTQQSRRAQRDECIARMIRKQNRARLTADVALLLSSGVRLLVRHGRERQRRPMVTIASTIHATRDGRSRPTERTRRRATRARTSAAGGRDARFLGESAPRGPAEDLRVAGDRNRPDASGREYGAIVPFADCRADVTAAQTDATPMQRSPASACRGPAVTRSGLGRLHSSATGVLEPDPDASYVASS